MTIGARLAHELLTIADDELALRIVKGWCYATNADLIAYAREYMENGA